MINNKSILYALFLGIAATACTESEGIKPEYDDSSFINFSVPAQVKSSDGAGETKSVLLDALPVGSSFGVLGYCVPYKLGTTTTPNYNAGSDIWSLKRNLCPPDVFFKQKVTVGTNGCTYVRPRGTGNNDPKYWYKKGYDTNNNSNGSIPDAENYNYNFFAYYPYEGCFTVDAPAAEGAPGAPVFTFTMPQEGDSETTELRHDITPDAMLAVLYNQTKDNGSVRFTFSHVLTALGFEVNNFSEYDLTIHSIKLEGSFYKTINIDLTGDKVNFSFPEDYYKGKYTIFDGTAMEGGDLSLLAPTNGSTVTSSLSPIGPNSGDDINKNFVMLISGTETSFGKKDVKVVIDYTFKNGRVQDNLTRPGTFTPQPGKRYIAQLNFVGDAFVINFVVDNNGEWENGAGDDGNTGNDDIVFE